MCVEFGGGGGFRLYKSCMMHTLKTAGHQALARLLPYNANQCCHTSQADRLLALHTFSVQF